MKLPEQKKSDDNDGNNDGQSNDDIEDSVADTGIYQSNKKHSILWKIKINKNILFWFLENQLSMTDVEEIKYMTWRTEARGQTGFEGRQIFVKNLTKLIPNGIIINSIFLHSKIEAISFYNFLWSFLLIIFIKMTVKFRISSC